MTDKKIASFSLGRIEINNEQTDIRTLMQSTKKGIQAGIIYLP